MKRMIRSMLWPLAIIGCLAIVVWISRSGEASAVPRASLLEADGYRIEIRTIEADSSPMEEKQFLVTITDASGVPVHPSSLRMQTWMPKMFCGIFTARFEQAAADGDYEATVLPIMSGRWVAEARITIGADEYTLRHEYDIG